MDIPREVHHNLDPPIKAIYTCEDWPEGDERRSEMTEQDKIEYQEWLDDAPECVSISVYHAASLYNERDYCLVRVKTSLNGLYGEYQTVIDTRKDITT